MIAMLEEGFDIEPMVNFMENLMRNPSKRSVDELYGFLEKNNLPITPDGCFLAYKKVRNDFKDIHSGTMDNSPGTVVEMERNKVDDDKDRTCSTGLHFCGMSYLNHFGGSDSRTVIVKIDPSDVVSIPSDYNGAKGRACRYTVIGELGVNPEQAFDKPVQANANGTQTIEPPKPVAPRPVKEGSSAFYQGYTDGWNDMDCRDEYNQDYVEGFDKGQRDADNGVGPRYRYVAPIRSNPGAWPFPR